MIKFLLNLFDTREYTGVKDLKGRKIRVGDILLRWGNYYLVKSYKGRIRMAWIVSDTVNRFPDEKCLIVGNSKNNPELLQP